MEFWKTHAKLRVVMIAILFLAGVFLTIMGWRLTGKLAGLGLMCVGVLCLLVALWIYNKPFGRMAGKK